MRHVHQEKPASLRLSARRIVLCRPLPGEAFALLAALASALMLFATFLPLIDDWIATLIIAAIAFVIVAALLAPLIDAGRS